MASIVVFCGSSSGFDHKYREAAVALGAEIAEQGHQLVYGGGCAGLMGAVADAARSPSAQEDGAAGPCRVPPCGARGGGARRPVGRS